MNEEQNNTNIQGEQVSVTTAPIEQTTTVAVQPETNNTIISNQAESIGNEPISQIEKEPKKGINKLVIAIIILAIICAASVAYYLTRGDSNQTSTVEEKLPVSDESLTGETSNYEKIVKAEVTANNKTYTIEYGINIEETELIDYDTETTEDKKVTGYKATIDILLDGTKINSIVNTISENKEDIVLDNIDVGTVTTIKDIEQPTEYLLFEIVQTKWTYMGIDKEVFISPMIYSTDGKLITSITTSETGLGSYWETGADAIITENIKYKYLVQNNSIIYLENQVENDGAKADRVTLTIKSGEVSKEKVQVSVDGAGQMA